MSDQRKQGKQLVGTWLSVEEYERFVAMMAELRMNKSDLLKAGLEELARRTREQEDKKNDNDNDR